MAMTLLKDVEAAHLRKDLPKFDVGDTVRVSYTTAGETKHATAVRVVRKKT